MKELLSGLTITGTGTTSFRLESAGVGREVLIDPHNERVKLYDVTAAELHEGQARELLDELALIGHAFTKVIAYVRDREESILEETDFRREGTIRGFFADHADAHIRVRYTRKWRSQERDAAALDEVLETALYQQFSLPELQSGYLSAVARPEDAAGIAALLKASFQDYPVPVTAAAVEKQIRDRGSCYRVVRDHQGRLAAAAAAEIDSRHQTAEITDCVTQERHRGRGLMTYLVWQLEKDMRQIYGITDLYSLARAGVQGINNIFFRRGYGFGGRLVNNCRMPSGWESMNIWCKTAGAPGDLPADDGLPDRR